VPDLELAQLKFEVAHGLGGDKNLLKIIKENKMPPFYRSICKELKWKEDSKLWADMNKENEDELKKLEDKIKDAEENLGESEHREALLAKAEYLTKIGEKDAAIEAVRKTMEKTVGLGNRMDLIFLNIRNGLFWLDHSLVKANLDKATTLMEEGGDWDRRNRLKVYEELMDYTQFVKYAVYASMISLERRELYDKVVKGSEILEVLHQCPKVKKYLNSFYNCHYAEFFACLADVEQICKKDRYLNSHYAFYVREMKIKAFGQLLESYRSLTLSYMADAFGITEEFMDQELSRYIADGRLHCKIDKVRGIVITNRPDSKNAQYHSTIKQGDILLNRVQKLSRVINI